MVKEKESHLAGYFPHQIGRELKGEPTDTSTRSLEVIPIEK